MFEYLQGLHPLLSYSLSTLLVIAAVIISLFAKIKWDKQSLSIGGTDDGDKKNNIKEANQKSSTVKVQERNCIDCVFYVLALREKFEIEYVAVKDSVLKDQMNFAEQKLSEVKTTATTEFTKKLKDLELNKNGDISIEEQFFRETTRYELFCSVLREVMHIIKDEIRRSFKENGYFDFQEGEFSNYLRNKMDYLESLALNHFSSRYPSYNKILPLSEIKEIYLDNRKELESTLREVFTISRSIKTKADTEVKNKKEEFKKRIDSFINKRNKAQDED